MENRYYFLTIKRFIPKKEDRKLQCGIYIKKSYPQSPPTSILKIKLILSSVTSEEHHIGRTDNEARENRVYPY